MQRIQSSPTALELVSTRSTPEAEAVRPTDPALVTASLRIAFGVIWAVDAGLKWVPAFSAGFLAMLTGVAQDQPRILRPWFNLVTAVASDGRANLLALGSAAFETYLAVALLTGFARKLTYILGAGYTALIWATAEGFGGPYVPGTTTDVGAAIIYTLLFLTLLVHDAGSGFSRLTLDRVIERRAPGWRRVAEFGRGRPRVRGL